jgi:hypothetical protein
MYTLHGDTVAKEMPFSVEVQTQQSHNVGGFVTNCRLSYEGLSQNVLTRHILDVL